MESQPDQHRSPSPLFSNIPRDDRPAVRKAARKKGGGKRYVSRPSLRQDNWRSTREDQQLSPPDAMMEDNSSEDRHQNSSLPSGAASAPSVNLQSVSRPAESTASSCVYTVQAVHGILTSAARAGDYDRVANMKTRYWRRHLRKDQTIKITPHDAPFFDHWNKHRETTAQKQHEQAWIKDYGKLHTSHDTSDNMQLAKFATLAAVSAVHHTKHQPIPSTLPSASTDLLEFLAPDSRMDVDHVAPSTSDQNDRSSTNVVGQTTLEGRGKRIKKHADPAIPIVWHGQPPFVQAVFQLLADPLYALLGTDKYKAFLQRPESFHPIGQRFANVAARQLVDFPAHVSNLLQGKPSPQVDLTWLYNSDEEQHVAQCFARDTLQVLKEALRPHSLEPEDEMDCHPAFRTQGLLSRYRRSPTERLFTSTFSLSYDCCGNIARELFSGELLHFTHTGKIHPPTSDPCSMCSESGEATFKLEQAPAFVLLYANSNRATFQQPPEFDYQRIPRLVADFELPTYTCCGFIAQELDESLTTFLLSGRDWRRYEHGHVTLIGQNIDEHPTPLLIMYRRD